MIILMLFIRSKLEITDAPKLANYIDHLEFDEDGKLFTRLYDKRDDFDFPIVNCPWYLSSNIPESPTYGVFVSQLMRYARVCSWRCSVQRIYSGFKVIETGIILTETSDYFSEILWSSYRPCSRIWHICVTYVEWSVHWLTYDWFPVVLSKSSRMPHVGQEMLTRSGTPDLTPFGEFMILLIRYTYTLCITEFVSLRTMFTD